MDKKTSFLNKPFDLNRNGKIDSAEVALIMMAIDDINEKKETDIDGIKNNIIDIDIDDMDIKGI